jgi:glucosamine--fructose-6-phosphate aminotransferase (isomerizing)
LPSSQSIATTLACSSVPACNARSSSASAATRRSRLQRGSLLRETRECTSEDGDLVAITSDGARFLRAEDGSAVERELIELDWDDESAEKAGFETFMLKEIYEQPDAVADDRRSRAPRPARARGLPRRRCLKVLRRSSSLAGTSYHAAVAARYAIEVGTRARRA